MIGGFLVAALFLTATPALAAASISPPASKNLGTAATGSPTLSAQLGTVSVAASGLVAPNFVATVSATVFITAGGGANKTIANGSVRYWSGPATSFSGLLGSPVPGQLTALNAVNLSVSRTAFSGTGLLLSITAAWNPTIIIDIPSAAIAGTYSGTITHSVA